MDDNQVRIDFVSLGMVVLDELRFPDGKIITDSIGGSGAYSTLGARIVTPQENQSIGALIIAGNDFPDEVVMLLLSWRISLEVVTENCNSSRGLLEYHDMKFGRKSFRYLTKPLQPLPSSLPLNLLSSRSFHLLRPPAQIMTEVGDLNRLRTAAGIKEQPLVVWEPFPSLCTPENLDVHIEACKVVDIFSPNHLELLGLFGETDDNYLAIHSRARELLQRITASKQRSGFNRPAIIVRMGERGCLVVDRQQMFSLPSFHSDASKVVDATGGGNTFLGAFTVALARTGDLLEAAKWGSVAASFAIEQIGLPNMSLRVGEQWNGQSVEERYRFYEEEKGGKLPW